jgi:hypothetical protein
LHFSLDLFWVVNGVLFCICLFATEQWQRLVPRTWEVFPNALSAAIQYSALRMPIENGWIAYDTAISLFRDGVRGHTARDAHRAGAIASDWQPIREDIKIFQSPSCAVCALRSRPTMYGLPMPIVLEPSGKQPVWLSTVMRDHIQPTARKLGIKKKISWHTFRHTFSSILKGNGEDVKVVQELLRYSTSRMTLDTYTQALGPDKRAAQSKVVGMIRPKGRVFSVYRDADGFSV